MLNRMELVQSVEIMKGEYAEAVLKGNNKLAKSMINEIVRLEVITNEEIIKKNLKLVEESRKEEFEFDVQEEEAIGQEVLIERFSKQLKEVVKKKENTTKTPISEYQYKTIMSAMRDRVGLDIGEKQVEFLQTLNLNQASGIIRILNSISFLNQRVMLTKAIDKLKGREDFAMIITEIRNNIFKKAWFDANEDLLRMSRELQEPTDAQIKRIADVARYPETHYTLLNDFNIDVLEYDQRPEGKLSYKFNWFALREDIRVNFNREEASNFIQTYDYITNLYEGVKLEQEQMNNLRRLYTQLGEYDKTRLIYLSTLRKDYYDTIVKELDERLRYNKIAKNLKDSRIREAMGQNNLIKKSRYARETRSIVLSNEQQEAKEMCDFVFGIYSCIGQEVPDEMNRLLPYFIQRGESIYATVEECHYQEFRRMVFEQRAIIKEVDKEFNWGALVANQPIHILKALGLDMMM